MQKLRKIIGGLLVRELASFLVPSWFLRRSGHEGITDNLRCGVHFSSSVSGYRVLILSGKDYLIRNP